MENARFCDQQRFPTNLKSLAPLMDTRRAKQVDGSPGATLQSLQTLVVAMSSAQLREYLYIFINAYVIIICGFTDDNQS